MIFFVRFERVKEKLIRHDFYKNFICYFPQVLDDGNPWFCPSCQSHQLAEKRLRICRWPSTLIVYIKRFLYHSKTAVKVDDAVCISRSYFNRS